MKIWAFVFFILPLAAVVYNGWHLWTLLPTHNLWLKTAVSVLPLILTVLMIGSFLVGYDGMSMPVATIAYQVLTSWIIVLLYMTIAFLLLDILRLVGLLPIGVLHANGHTFALLTLAIATLLLAGNIRYNIKHRELIALNSNSKTETKTKIVLLSDLHLGYHNRASAFRRWVGLINAEKPQAVLIAGDIIDNSIRPLQEDNIADIFRAIEAPVYACLGNHEYYSSEPRAEQFYKDANITLLRDSVAILPNNIAVVGRDDRTNRQRASLQKILTQARANGTLANQYTILLDHQPYHLEEAERAGIDFQFSGHTHYGQVWPISWITNLLYEKAYGNHQRENTRYYISSGLGIWGGKFRIGTRSEYVVLELEP